jgi:type I restriction enzyme, R subunit
LQRQVDEQGLERSEIDFEGSDLERKVTNTGTNDRLVDEFVDNCRKDVNGIPAKSIIFAISHKHAIELLEGFNRRYPNWQAQGLAQVIDSRMERAEKTLEDFKLKDMPRVAISVDMLDTGIDVPAIQTLVFAKPIFSQVKFWQMIGRGTRLWRDPITGERKADFLIIDHWENFKYFDKNPEGEIINPSEPLPARLFRARLCKLALLREHDDQVMIEVTLTQLHTVLEHLPRNNARVREHNTRLDTLQADATWMQEDLSAQGQLSRVVAPLMHFLQVDVYSTLFELHTENLAIAFLQGQQETFERLRVQIKDELQQLARDLPEVRAKESVLAWVESTDFWTHLSLQRILDLQIQLSPIMRYRQSEQRSIIKLYFPDVMKRRRWITYGPAGEGAFVDHYQGEVETHVKELAEQVPTLVKIKRSEIPEVEEMQALAEVLNTPDLFIREEILQQVYENPEMRLVDFMRHILDVQRFPSREQRIKAAFQRYVGARPNLTVVQRSFLYAVRALLIQRADEQTALTADQLSQVPFNRIGKVEELFNDHELTELLDFANTEVA